MWPVFALAGLALLLLAGGRKPESTSQKPPTGGGSGGGGGGSDPYAPPWNPPAPGRPLQQSEVTPAMQAWAIEIQGLKPPIHTEVYRVFPEGSVIARADWHTKQASTGKTGIFQGVTLYWDPNFLA